MAEKMTKAMWYDVIKTIVETSEAVELETKKGAVEFIEAQKEQLEKKALKAKEKAAETKAAGDELRAAVEAVLTDEFQTADEITAKVEGEEVTKSKVVARLTQLVKAEVAVKEAAKVDGKKVMTYKLA